MFVVLTFLALALSGILADTCPTATVAGDPVFVGFYHQKFTFNGHPESIYQLFSDSTLVLNSKFGDSNPSSPNRGTVMKEMFLSFGENQLSFSCSSFQTSSFELNGASISLNGSSPLEVANCIIVQLNARRNRIFITSPLHEIYLFLANENSAHINTSYFTVKLDLPTEDPSSIGGLIGQTADPKANISLNEALFTVATPFGRALSTKREQLSECPISSNQEKRSAHHGVRQQSLPAYNANEGFDSPRLASGKIQRYVGTCCYTFPNTDVPFSPSDITNSGFAFSGNYVGYALSSDGISNGRSDNPGPYAFIQSFESSGPQSISRSYQLDKTAYTFKLDTAAFGGEQTYTITVVVGSTTQSVHTLTQNAGIDFSTISGILVTRQSTDSHCVTITVEVTSAPGFSDEDVGNSGLLLDNWSLTPN